MVQRFSTSILTQCIYCMFCLCYYYPVHIWWWEWQRQCHSWLWRYHEVTSKWAVAFWKAPSQVIKEGDPGQKNPMHMTRRWSVKDDESRDVLCILLIMNISYALSYKSFELESNKNTWKPGNMVCYQAYCELFTVCIVPHCIPIFTINDIRPTSII